MKLKKPYYVICPTCGEKLLRTTDINVKSCYCGTKLIFGGNPTGKPPVNYGDVPTFRSKED